MSKRSRGRSAGSLHDKLRWSDVLDGRLFKLATETDHTEGQSAELRITGKLSELFVAPGAPVFSDKPPTEAADALAKLICDALEAATRAGVTVIFEADGKVHRLNAHINQRELGRIEGDLARALQTSRQAMAAAASRDVSRFSGNANAPSWLGIPSGTAQDGRPIYARGTAFNPGIARAIWAAFDRYIEGDSLEQVASYLNDRGYQPPGVSPLPLGDGRKAHPWKAQMVDFQLASLGAIGLRSGTQLDMHAPQAPAPQRPALLTWSTFRLVQDLRSAPLAGGRADARYLLSGRVFCRRCQQEGHSAQPMEPAKRSGGMTLVCSRMGAKHPGPLYEDFEAQLLQWLQSLEDVSRELDRILEATDEELRHAMASFGWPPDHSGPSDSPQSLEEAVRAIRSARTTVEPIDAPARVVAFLKALQSEPMAESRAAMRRKMRNVLRRHIACVFVSAGEQTAAEGNPRKNPVQPISVEQRDAIALLARSDSLFDKVGRLKDHVALFEVTVQRFGREAPDPKLVMAIPARSFKLPEGVDWDAILLPPHGEEISDQSAGEAIEGTLDPDRAANGLAVGSAVSGEIAPGSSNPAAPGAEATSTGRSEVACGHGEHTGYQPHSDDSRPWGVHICANDVDDLGDQIRSSLFGEQASHDEWNQADHLAFGMLLSSLEFYARVDLWLRGALALANTGHQNKELHLECFQVLRPVTSSEYDLGQDLFSISTYVDKYSGSEERLQKLFHAAIRDSPELRLALSMASQLEGLLWARAAQSRSVRSPLLAALAWRAILTNPSTSKGALQALGRYFEFTSAWSWLAESIAGTLASHVGCTIERLEAQALMKSLQAQTFDPQDPRPSPVHLHGDGRVVRKFRRALGL